MIASLSLTPLCMIQEEELSTDRLIPHFVSRYMLPSLRAAASPQQQICAAFTIQQLLALLRERIDSLSSGTPDVVFVDVPTGGHSATTLKQLFEPQVAALDHCFHHFERGLRLHASAFVV
jgi:hypothetical protein